MAEPLFIKVAGQPTTSLNNRLHHRLSPVSFGTFLKDSFLHNLNGWEGSRSQSAPIKITKMTKWQNENKLTH